MKLPDDMPDELKHILNSIDKHVGDQKDKSETDLQLMRLELADCNTRERLQQALTALHAGPKKFKVGDIVAYKPHARGDKRYGGPFVVTTVDYNNPHVSGVTADSAMSLDTAFYGVPYEVEILHTVKLSGNVMAVTRYAPHRDLELVPPITGER